MRKLLLLVLFFITISLTGFINSQSQVNSLNGTWLPISQEMGGKPLPKAVFESQKLIISDSSYTFSAESIDKGIIKYRDNTMDIYGKDGVNMGKHFTALYKYENEQLTICYNLAGNNYPDSFQTKNKPLWFLSVYIREMKK